MKIERRKSPLSAKSEKSEGLGRAIFFEDDWTIVESFTVEEALEAKETGASEFYDPQTEGTISKEETKNGNIVAVVKFLLTNGVVTKLAWSSQSSIKRGKVKMADVVVNEYHKYGSPSFYAADVKPAQEEDTNEE